MEIGHVYDMPPMRPDEANTTYFPAGAIKIGVEYRDLTPEALTEYYGGDEAYVEELRRTAPLGIEDRGVSLHVFDADGRWEYLRFDLFEDAPHYHYNHLGGGRNHIVPFDETAHGPITEWAVNKIRSGELAPMLVQAGGSELADALDPDVLARTADQVAAYTAELRNRLTTKT
ncbi:DUF7700 domain-containing protein [Candidatus Poriferisocius sp.]|uniref:DUF7700 domain-containing protein n=1 Tax=Candidatus Poriferisocius sp. TaxID=3101276 RepID=UPI003B02DEBB